MTNALDFDPGVAIVAGGSGGIGAGICRRFAAAGIPLVFTYRSDEESARSVAAEIAAAGGRTEHYKLDLSIAADVESLFATVRSRHGHIAHVIDAAGPHFEFNFIGSIPEVDWHRVINADLHGAFN